MGAFDPSPAWMNLCDDHAQVHPCKFCREIDNFFEDTPVAQFLKYRGKPVVIEALCLARDNIKDVKRILGEANYVEKPWDPINLYIKNEHGEVVASPGDWIIKGSRGEYYPCKNSTFKEKYEAVNAQVK